MAPARQSSRYRRKRDDSKVPLMLNPRCEGCPFARRAQGFVPGEGPIKTAKVWIVGQDPGEHEFDEGRPFVEWAPSGKYLSGVLKLAGVRRSDIYITNVRKCWPPWQEKPSTKELDEALLHCAKYLDEEMAQGSPNVIITLGADAAKRLTGRDQLIKKWQGSVFKSEELGDAGGQERTTVQDSQGGPSY